MTFKRGRHVVFLAILFFNSLSASASDDSHRGAKAEAMRELAKKFPDLVCEVHVNLNRCAEIVGEPSLEATGGTEEARKSFCFHAVKNIRQSAPFKSLPADKYDQWKVMVVRFDASQMIP